MLAKVKLYLHCGRPTAQRLPHHRSGRRRASALRWNAESRRRRLCLFAGGLTFGTNEPKVCIGIEESLFVTNCCE
jgi:hypothetical protein